MPSNQAFKYNLFLLLLSLLLHFAMFLSFQLLSIQKSDKSDQEIFMVEQIDQKELRKLRVAGVNNGKKEFSSPLSLSQLNQATLTQLPKNKKSVAPTKKSSYIPAPVKNIARQLPGRVGFDLQFAPPEGIPEDELNSVEKIFFGFYKRCYETFVSAVYRTISEQLAVKPYLKKYLTGKSMVLNATVTFDRKGNIINISKITGTSDFELVKLYKKMLINMNTIPNPPALFIKKTGKFTMYYKLKVGLK